MLKGFSRSVRVFVASKVSRSGLRDLRLELLHASSALRFLLGAQGFRVILSKDPRILEGRGTLSAVYCVKL